MTGPELAIVVLIYVASLLLGQRAIAMAVPEVQELGFVIAALVAIALAAGMYYRRERDETPRSVPLAVGGVLAITAIMAGMFSHLLWQSLFMPMLSLPVAAVATGLAPLVIFPLTRRSFGDDRPVTDPIGMMHVALTGLIAAV